MKLSKTVRNIVPSGTMAINARVFEMKQKGLEVINLSVGEPDFNTPEHAKNSAIRAIEDNKTRYDKVAGLIELRREISRTLKEENGLEYSPEEMIVANGAKGALTNSCFALLDEGDEVLIPSPYWVSYPEIAKLAGGVPIYVETLRKNDFKIAAEDINRAATERTKLLIICNPSNPLGTVHKRSELEAVAEICYEKGISIISDEVYERICFEDEFVSMAQVSEKAREITVIVNGLSKSIPMTGWRIGYTACADADFNKAVTAFQGHITSHPSTVSQWAGVEALHRGKEYTQFMVEKYRARMETITAFLRKNLPQLDFIKPKGAFYIFIDISAVKDRFEGNASYSHAFSMALLNEKQVAVVPGSEFGKEGYIRISYASDMKTLMEGFERIAEFINL